MQHMTTTLERLEGDSATIGGVLFRFPSGTAKKAVWESGAPITDTKEAAQKCTTQVVDALLREGKHNDIQSTNWTSCVAAVQRHMSDWNDKLRAATYARGGHDDASLSTAHQLT